MDFKRIKRIEFENGTFKVLRVSMEKSNFLVVGNDGLVSHMSFSYVEQEISNGRATIVNVED